MRYCPTSVSIYPPFPARSIGYGICPLRVSIYLSAPSTADIRCGILPHGRRCRIGYDIGCDSYVSVSISPFSSPTYRIWDRLPERLHVSIRPYRRRYRIWDIAPCPCLSIPFSNHEIWIWDRPPARRGCGICPLRPPDPSEISPRQWLSIPFPSPKYRIWDLTPTRQYLPIRPCSRRYRMWYIAPRQYLSIPLSSPKYGICPDAFRLFWFL